MVRNHFQGDGGTCSRNGKPALTQVVSLSLCVFQSTDLTLRSLSEYLKIPQSTKLKEETCSVDTPSQSVSVRSQKTEHATFGKFKDVSDKYYYRCLLDTYSAVRILALLPNSGQVTAFVHQARQRESEWWSATVSGGIMKGTVKMQQIDTSRNYGASHAQWHQRRSAIENLWTVNPQPPRESACSYSYIE